MDFLPDIEKFKNFFDGTDSKNEISIAVEEAKKYDIFMNNFKGICFEFISSESNEIGYS